MSKQLHIVPTPNDTDFAYEIPGVAAIYVSDDAKAYAHLIAAMPKLLGALEESGRWLRAALDCKEWLWDADQREAAEAAHAFVVEAIAEARGENHV